MAIRKDEKPAIVAMEHDDYGLYVGPKGGYGRAGIQCKSPKWTYLFTQDEDGTPNLMNVVNYLKANTNDVKSLDWQIQKFITEYQEWRKTNVA